MVGTSTSVLWLCPPQGPCRLPFSQWMGWAYRKFLWAMPGSSTSTLLAGSQYVVLLSDKGWMEMWFRHIWWTQTRKTEKLKEQLWNYYQKTNRGAWVAQSVKRLTLTLAQVMISQSVGLSSTLGSVLTAWGLLGILSLPISAPPPLSQNK